jgi:hypothetical protein
MISEGYVADFVILQENPLENLKNLDSVREVIVKGESVYVKK